MEQINGLKKIADTQAYEAERKVIEAEISALKELIKQKQIEANGKLAEAKAKYGNPDE